MNNLVCVIGPAPSEDPMAFEKRLAAERLRIMEVLNEIRGFTPASKIATTRKRKDDYDLSPTEMLAAMKELGINSTEELVARIKEIEARGTDNQDS